MKKIFLALICCFFVLSTLGCAKVGDASLESLPNTTEEKEEVIKQRETKAFKEAYANWKENYKIVVSSTLLDQISFDNKGK